MIKKINQSTWKKLYKSLQALIFFLIPLFQNAGLNAVPPAENGGGLILWEYWKKDWGIWQQHTYYSGLVKKTDYTTTEIENKIPSVTGFVTTTVLNTKATRDWKSYHITKLATKAAFNTTAIKIESNVPDITRIKGAAKNLAKKREIRNALDLGDKIREKIKKIQAFDSSQFFGKSHFEDDGTPSYLVFKPVFRYFTTPNGRKRTLVWKSERFSKESIKPPATLSNNLVCAFLSCQMCVLNWICTL